MARRKPQPNQIALYARLLTEVADGGPVSPRLGQMEADILSDPNLCVDALGQFASLPDGVEDENCPGYLMLMTTWLSVLRHEAEAGNPGARNVIAAFQRHLAELSDTTIDGETFLAVTMALSEAGIPASPEVQLAMAEVAEDFADEESMGDADWDQGLSSALSGIAELAADDPFAFIAMLMQAGHAMPVDAKAAMAGALAGNENTAAAAVLLLLDPVPEVRRAAAEALALGANRLDGVSVRRLIALRNWVPAAERSAIDALVRKARSAGVDCAAWPEDRLEGINSSSLDGSGSQGFLIVTKEGRKRSLSSILTKHGVSDAWTTAQSKAEITAILATARRESGLLAVSRSYLDRSVRHHLHVGLDTHDLPPPAGLIEIAERIGANDWTPRCFDWRAELATLVADLSEKDERHQRQVLQQSEFWTVHDPMVDSWFEDGPAVSQALADFKRPDPKRLGDASRAVLTNVVEPARDKWAEHFVWIALRLRESAKPDPIWERFAILAHALTAGTPLSEIAVMEAIATRTVEAAWQR
ncbi:hypothetical protein [Aurantimonas sp. VKM B-3413]|uniref:hypothetical protein n=1 Tax=Aurantimonas sp. VKM B-3413 TaxID=2779401 RepID=UPI001E4939A9|nr:hypothetical protein [Aurantimonas sp. VKM B-3413]MCB8837118.1 hypothetical protein [Aurantimonas sp. VKM B-3413]